MSKLFLSILPAATLAEFFARDWQWQGAPVNGFPCNCKTAAWNTGFTTEAACVAHWLADASPCVDVNDNGSVCGNGNVESGEECDDGNTNNGDGCSFDCNTEAVDPVCGNGQVEDGEECDDGNTSNNDGCNSDCKTEAAGPVCGNGQLESGEECDDGNTTNGDGCSSTCTSEAPAPVCGNGELESGEQCDDGNTNSGDGCSANCNTESTPNDSDWKDMMCQDPAEAGSNWFLRHGMGVHDGTYNAATWESKIANQHSCSATVHNPVSTNTVEELGAYFNAAPKVIVDGVAQETVLAFGHPIEKDQPCGTCWALAFKKNGGGCQYVTIKAVETWTWSMEMGQSEVAQLQPACGSTGTCGQANSECNSATTCEACINQWNCQIHTRMPFKFIRMENCLDDVVIDGADCSATDYESGMFYDASKDPEVKCTVPQPDLLLL